MKLVVAMPRPKELKRILRLVATYGVGQLHLVNACRVEKSYFQSPILQNSRDYLLEGLEQGGHTHLPTLHVHKLLKPFVEDQFAQISSGHNIWLAHPPRSVHQLKATGFLQPELAPLVIMPVA